MAVAPAADGIPTGWPGLRPSAGPRPNRGLLPVGALSPGVNDDSHDGVDGEPWEDEPEPRDVPIHPGDPSAENVAFVVLGALVTLFVLARIAGLV